MLNNILSRPVYLILISAAFINTGCIVVPAKDSQGNTSSTNNGLRVVALALTGYNYTDRPIDSFTVDGLGGGNIRVSGEHSGGGGDVCCVSYVVGAKARIIKVRWQKSACWENIDSLETKKFRHRPKYIYDEVSVEIDKRIPPDPSFLEVHFYPDGHVEAAITAEHSIPRMKLTKDRENKSGLSQCVN